MTASADLSAYACMFQLDPKGYAELSELVPTSRVQSVQGETACIVEVERRKLHSSRDPIREARRFARRQDLSQHSVVILFGYGSGHVARALRKQCSGLFVVFDPDLEVLHTGLPHGDPDPEIQIITRADHLGNTLYRLLSAGDAGKIVSWVPSVRQDPAAYEYALERTQVAIERARTRDLTTQCRVDGWLDFYLTNLPALTQSPGLAQLKNGLKGYPAVICAAGPSLTKNAALLNAVRDNALIIAVNTAAAALARCGVQPHAIISVESLDITMQLRDIPWIDKIPAFLELTGHPAAFQLPFTKKIPISVDTSSVARFSRMIDPGHCFNAGFCVANAAAALAQQLGCNGLILLGQDLAYDGDRVYAQGTVFDDIRVQFDGSRSEHVNTQAKKAIESTSTGTLVRGITQAQNYRADWVEAWGDPETKVRTNQDFLHFRDWYIYAAPRLQEMGLFTINCTEGGAHLPGWDEIPFRDAIARHQLDQQPTGISVGEAFDRLLQQPATDPDTLVNLLESERQRAVGILTTALQSRGLVDDDPDADILADEALAGRLSALTVRIVESLNAAPLVRESLTRPLQQLHERQEVNTYSLARAVETRIAELDAKLAQAIATIRGQKTSDVAA